MTRQEAIRIVESELNRDYHSEGDSLVVVDKWTQEKPYGWIFFFNSKRYLDTKISEYRLGGNGPVVFERDSGEVIPLGTALPTEEAIEEYEAGRKNGNH
jgi:hypothetical protein